MTWEITVPQNAEPAQDFMAISPVKLNVGKSETSSLLLLRIAGDASRAVRISGYTW
jgi:hypothetical protein